MEVHLLFIISIAVSLQLIAIWYAVRAIRKDRRTAQVLLSAIALFFLAGFHFFRQFPWGLTPQGSAERLDSIAYLLAASGLNLIASLFVTIRGYREEVRESEENFRFLVEGVKDYAIFLLDPSGRVRTWNSGAERIKGYKAEEVLGKHFALFYPPEEVAAGKPERELEFAAREGRFEEENWRVRKDGSRFLADVIITPLHDAQGNLRGFAKVTRDVTEIKRAQEERIRFQREQIEALKQADRLKDDFLSVVSHELRTPLNSIMGFGSLLEDAVPGPLTPLQRGYVEKILLGAERMLALIENLLDFARVQAGKFEIFPSPTDYPRLVEEVFACLGPLIKAKGLFVETEISVPRKISLDGSRIHQLLENLVANAVKFTHEVGTIRVRAFLEGKFLVTEVSDDGIGIAPEDLPKLFLPFKQLDMSSTRPYGGTGLGLSIARAIAEAHGGSISAASDGRGKGATFRFEIPVDRDSE